MSVGIIEWNMNATLTGEFYASIVIGSTYQKLVMKLDIGAVVP